MSDLPQEIGDGRFGWMTSQPPYNCAIASPKKESKLKGLKSFIAYQLTPSVSPASKFDWLPLVIR